MKKVMTVALSLMIVFSFVILLASRSIAQMHEMEGNVVCVEVDEKGNVNAMEQFTECKGVFMMVGKDGKLYAVSGTEEQMKMMAKSPQKKVSGQVGGSQRGLGYFCNTNGCPEGHRTNCNR